VTVRKAAVIAVLVSSLIGPASGAQQQAAGTEAAHPEPVLATGELMTLLMDPLYKELQRSLAKPPRDRKAWAAIYSAAVRLAEANNLLFFRSSSRYTTDPRWPALAADGRSAASDIAEAVFVALQNPRASDAAPIKAKLAAVSASCNACHRGLGTDARTVKP
jgi:hypothetical protein